jgi:hypothetical protein
MSVLWLFPLALLICAVGAALAWPVAYRAGREAYGADDFDVRPETLPAAEKLVAQLADLRAYVAELEAGHAADTGHRGFHRWETAAGSANQVPRSRRLAALREATEEFHAIVRASYASGELPMYRGGASFLRAHLAAAT